MLKQLCTVRTPVIVRTFSGMQMWGALMMLTKIDAMFVKSR